MPSPGLQYMNIYTKTAPRLGCFNHITQSGFKQEDLRVYLHGNAQSYESFLDSILKKKPFHYNTQDHQVLESNNTVTQPISYTYMPENAVNKYKTYFEKTNPVSNIYFTIKRNEMITVVKSKMKVNSESFTPTALPTL